MMLLYRMRDLRSFKSGDLLEALTLKNADELFNMEKLEIIGDVFLKYRQVVSSPYLIAP
jgi:hypothetical protein